MEVKDKKKLFTLKARKAFDLLEQVDKALIWDGKTSNIEILGRITGIMNEYRSLRYGQTPEFMKWIKQ